MRVKEHLYSFVDVYNCVKRLKALKGSTVYDYIVKYWEKEPERFKKEPHHMFPGLNRCQNPAFRSSTCLNSSGINATNLFRNSLS